jgi:ribonuclease HI
MQKILIYADGGARGNPGPAGSGAVVLDENENVLAEYSEYIGETTNNVAEYKALLGGLISAAKHFPGKTYDLQVEVRMDSQLVIRQLEGKYKVKHPNLKPLFAQAKEFIDAYFPNIIYTHVPREENTLADALANKAMDRGR